MIGNAGKIYAATHFMELVSNPMQKLPLFPLNTVLFPGVPLNLHIFEERYKLMINECIQGHQPFGVVMLRSGSEVLAAGREPQPYTIGCTALIAQAQPLGSGRMNIVAVGQDRFIIHDVERTRPYLVGNVELFPLENQDSAEFSQAVAKLRPWVERYLAVLEQTDNMRLNASHMPQDELALTYLAASLLKIDMHEKQELLGTANALDFAESVRQAYRKEVTLTDALQTRPNIETVGPFSVN